MRGRGPAGLQRQLEPPYSAAWGGYTVTVVSLSVVQQRFRIQAPGGEVLREIRAPFINLVDYPDLDGRHRHEFLRVVTHPESNRLADIRTYCFTRRGGLRNVLAMPYGFDTLLDLDGDGRPELISDDPAPLEWISGLAHGFDPSVPVVLRWDGKRYVVASHRFPAVARRKADAYRVELFLSLQRFRENLAGDGSDSSTRDQALRAALGYWASLATLGEEQKAQPWLVRTLHPSLRDTFLESLPEVRQQLALLPSQITTDSRRKISPVE